MWCSRHSDLLWSPSYTKATVLSTFTVKRGAQLLLASKLAVQQDPRSFSVLFVLVCGKCESVWVLAVMFNLC